jgi:hypothetical protein
MGLLKLRDYFCNTNPLTHSAPQGSREYERIGRLSRRKRRTNERHSRSVQEPLLSLPIVKLPLKVPLLLFINKLAVLFKSYPPITNLARKFLANTNLPLVAFNNSRRPSTITFSALDTPPRHMMH